MFYFHLLFYQVYGSSVLQSILYQNLKKSLFMLDVVIMWFNVSCQILGSFNNF